MTRSFGLTDDSVKDCALKVLEHRQQSGDVRLTGGHRRFCPDLTFADSEGKFNVNDLR